MLEQAKGQLAGEHVDLGELDLDPAAKREHGAREPPAQHLAGRLVWDLLPGEHAAAWRPDEVPLRRRVTVRFLDRQGRTVSHWNKLLKGALVRHLLVERPAGPEDLAGWEHPSGYRVDAAASDLASDPAVLVLREA